MTKKRCVFWLAGIAAVLAAAAVVVIVLHEPFLIAAGSRLMRDDVPETDAAMGVVLMGDLTMSRAERTLGLYRLGTIKRIILIREKNILFAGTTSAFAPADIFRDFFYKEGVPIEHVTLLADCATTSTVDEAECLKAYLDNGNQRPDRLVVITTWTHTARAGWVFDRILAPTKIEMAAARLENVVPQNWWQHELGVLSVFDEYLKWSYWKVREWRGQL